MAILCRMAAIVIVTLSVTCRAAGEPCAKRALKSGEIGPVTVIVVLTTRD
jgi:hypothetical protein